MGSVGKNRIFPFNKEWKLIISKAEASAGHGTEPQPCPAPLAVSRVVR